MTQSRLEIVRPRNTRRKTNTEDLYQISAAEYCDQVHAVVTQHVYTTAAAAVATAAAWRELTSEVMSEKLYEAPVKTRSSESAKQPR